MNVNILNYITFVSLKKHFLIMLGISVLTLHNLTCMLLFYNSKTEKKTKN